ncbi:MAG: ribosome recycling factor, partial [Eubacteriales bacterium]|nr:ribosome recycling factor [Eubacteriales bacterium]
VDYYGTPTPINQVGSVSVAEARILVIQPWDKGLLNPIMKAIQASDIGINPQNDGSVIRLTFPQLTEERRKELAKGISKRGEEAKVAVRNIRRDEMDALKKAKKANELTEDDLRDEEEKLQKLTDKVCKEIDEIAANKTKEIMSV